MPEIPQDIIHQVRRVLADKNKWYVSSEGKPFDWSASTEALARELGISQAEKVREVIASAFTPDALTMAGDTPLIEALAILSHDYNALLTVWTVGDPDWQRTKAKNTGVLDILVEDHFHFAAQNKVDAVPQLASGFPGILVVDDKVSSLSGVRALGLSVPVFDFLLKIADDQANPMALISWLEQQLLEGIMPSGSRWLIDLDGTLIDTDGTISGKASEAIASLM